MTKIVLRKKVQEKDFVLIKERIIAEVDEAFAKGYIIEVKFTRRLLFPAEDRAPDQTVLTITKD